MMYFPSFQSTLPVRGATGITARTSMMFGISIHAPRTGSDERISSMPRIDLLFQSTLPVRGATVIVHNVLQFLDISIHAPRTGSDKVRGQFRAVLNDFNPRSPYGERQPVNVLEEFSKDFNPRSPYGERRLLNCLIL